MILTPTNWSFLHKQKFLSAPILDDDWEKCFISEMMAAEESKARASRSLQEFELSIDVSANAETNNVGYFAIISCSFLFDCVVWGTWF